MLGCNGRRPPNSRTPVSAGGDYDQALRKKRIRLQPVQKEIAGNGLRPQINLRNTYISG